MNPEKEDIHQYRLTFMLQCKVCNNVLLRDTSSERNCLCLATYV